MIRVYRPASNETLVIVLHEVFQDSALALADDAVLEREDAELQIHRLLERAPETIEPGLVVLDRERFTDTGPIDLFCRDTDGRTVVVEVKRTRAVAAHVGQLPATASGSTSTPPTGRAAASWSRRDRAAGAGPVPARGYAFVELDFDVLKGEAAPELTLFD